MVDAREEEAIEENLRVRQCFGEVLTQPRTGFAGHHGLARQMGGGRSELGHQHITALFAEHFRFGHIGERIEVKPVCWRAVRLVARGNAARATPVEPFREDIFDDQIRQRLAIVALDSCHRFVRPDTRQFGKVLAQIIAALGLECGEELRRPSGIEILEGIVIEMFGLHGAGPVERGGVGRKEMIHGLYGIGIHHRALAARSRTLDPLARQRGHQKTRFSLVVRALPQNPHPLLHVLFAGRDEQSPTSFLRRELRTAKAPARPHREIHAQVARVADTHGGGERRHPVRRKEFAVFRFPALRAVDRDRMEATEAGLRERVGLGLQPFRIHGRAHPPVVAPGAHVARHGRPGRGRLRRKCQHRHHCKLTFAIGEQLRQLRLADNHLHHPHLHFHAKF